MSAVGCIRGATLISEFLAAIKAAQDVRLAGPRVEQGNGHNPAPSQQHQMSTSRSTTIATDAVEETKGAAFIVHGVSNAELPHFSYAVRLGCPMRSHSHQRCRRFMRACGGWQDCDREEFGSKQIRAEENPSNLR